MASEIDISNIALTSLGADAIRSFDEDNKRSRLCYLTYQYVRDLYLEDYEWSFNTKYIQLALLADDTHPKYTYVYKLPSDCLYARQLVDEVGKTTFTVPWEAFSDKIATDLEDAYLRYSEKIYNSGLFPMYFVSAIATQMAVEMAPAIVQDQKRYADLRTIAEYRLMVAREKDAELGSGYLRYDQDPENDSFVTP